MENLITFIYLFIGVILIWFSTLSMLRHRNMSSFVPFFLIGLLLCFQAAFLINEKVNLSALLIAEIIFSLIFLWVLITDIYD